MRANIVKGVQYWAVIDTAYNTVVITTQNPAVANFWKTMVNACRHQQPYDILAHDVKFRKK